MKEKYRLEVLLKLKMRQRKLCEIELARAIKNLKREEEKLEDLKNLKQKIRDQMKKARDQMREKIAGGQARIRESQVHLSFMEKLKEDEERLDSEIKNQREVVSEMEEKLKRARRDYIDAANELNIMEKHKELWTKKQVRQLSALENKQMNELGNTVHQMRGR